LSFRGAAQGRGGKGKKGKKVEFLLQGKGQVKGKKRRYAAEKKRKAGLSIGKRET